MYIELKCESCEKVSMLEIKDSDLIRLLKKRFQKQMKEVKCGNCTELKDNGNFYRLGGFIVCVDCHNKEVGIYETRKKETLETNRN